MTPRISSGFAMGFVLFLVFGCAGRQDVVRTLHRDVKSLTLRGQDLYLQARYDEAARFFDRARLLAIRISDPAGEAENLNNLGRLLVIAQDFPAAEEKLEQAYAINEAQGNKSGMATNLTNLGDLQLALGNPEAALVPLHAALVLESETKNDLGRASVLNNMSSAYRMMKDDQRAADVALEAWGIAEKEKQHRLAAASLRNVGRCQEAEGDDVAAARSYLQALEADRLVEYAVGIAEDLTARGHVLQKLKQWKSAADHFEHAYHINVQLQLRPAVQEDLAALIAIGRETGDAKLLRYQTISQKLRAEQQTHGHRR